MFLLSFDAKGEFGGVIQSRTKMRVSAALHVWMSSAAQLHREKGTKKIQIFNLSKKLKS